MYAVALKRPADKNAISKLHFGPGLFDPMSKVNFFLTDLARHDLRRAKRNLSLHPSEQGEIDHYVQQESSGCQFLPVLIGAGSIFFCTSEVMAGNVRQKKFDL